MAALYRAKKAPRRAVCGAGLVDTGRLRKSVVISGTLLCALIAAAFLVSLRWLVAVDIRGGPCVYVQAGHFGLAFDDLYVRAWYTHRHSAGVWW